MPKRSILFIHQNFPAQYLHVAAALAGSGEHNVMALGEVENIKSRPQIQGVRLWGYPAPAKTPSHTHRYARALDAGVRRGEIVARACSDLRRKGIVPDVIWAHPGWGESLFVKDIFPDAHLRLYCEFFYRGRGADVNFDPEYPSSLDDQMRVRAKNAAILISLAACDSAVSPTQWQRQVHPRQFHSSIEVLHEGVDTDLVKPDPAAVLPISADLTLTTRDEVVTYVARNLEPYRGFHVFMRALPELLRRRPRAHVVIVGNDGVSYGTPLPDNLTFKQKYLDDLGASLDLHRVHFLGRIPYSALIRVYQVSSAHVYLTYPFVLSWSLLEAMSAGCNIVASRTAPVEEVIQDGENGTLTDFFDEPALVDRIVDALERSRRLEGMAARARKHIVERFDLRRVCLPAQLRCVEKAL